MKKEIKEIQIKQIILSYAITIFSILAVALFIDNKYSNAIQLQSDLSDVRIDTYKALFISFIFITFGYIFLSHYTGKFKKIYQLIDKLELKASIAEKTQMVAHDIRVPLKIFEQAVQKLKQTSEKNNSPKEIDAIIYQVETLKHEMEGLLKDLRPANQPAKKDIVPTSLELVIKQSIDIIQMNPNQHQHINLEYDFNHFRKIHADPLMISRVIINIVKNAIKAIKQEGQIIFKTEEVEENQTNFVRLSIINNGPIIAHEKLEKIFETFYTEGKKDGTGLGLAICKDIMEQHSGKVWCTSNKLEGTGFHFHFPSVYGSISQKTINLPKEILKSTEVDNRNSQISSSEDNDFIVLVDDSIFVFEQWQQKIPKDKLYYFMSPEAFFDVINQSKLNPEQIKVILTDFYFGTASEQNGAEFAESLSISPKFKNIPIILSSDSEGHENQAFDMIIAKKAISIEELNLLISEKKKTLDPKIQGDQIA